MVDAGEVVGSEDAAAVARDPLDTARLAAPQRHELVGEGLRLVAPEPLDGAGDPPSAFFHADARDAAAGGAPASPQPKQRDSARARRATASARLRRPPRPLRVPPFPGREQSRSPMAVAGAAGPGFRRA